MTRFHQITGVTMRVCGDVIEQVHMLNALGLEPVEVCVSEGDMLRIEAQDGARPTYINSLPVRGGVFDETVVLARLP